MPHTFNPDWKSQLFNDYEAEWLANVDFAEMPRLKLRDGDYLEQWGGKTKEAKTQYDFRKKMSLLMDHASDLVDLRVVEIWRKNPERRFDESPFKAQIEQLLADVDGGGTDMNTFMRNVTEEMQVNGVDVLVDKEAVVVLPTNLADENSVPFLSRFSPLQRPDWETDHAGKYLWVRFDMGEEPRTDEQFEENLTRRHVTYTRDEVRVHITTEDGTETITNTHAMGEVPVVQVYWGNSIRDGNDGIATSIMGQLSPLSEYMLNLTSQAQIDLFMSVAFFIATGVTPKEVAEEIGASFIMAFEGPEADLKPVFANIDHITEKREWLAFLAMQQLRKGKVLGLNATMEGRAQSGIQVAIESSPLHSELATTAGVLERAEVEIMRLMVSRLRGTPVTTKELAYSVTYNKTFTLQSTKSILEEAKALSEIVGSSDIPSLLKAFLRRILDTVLIQGTPEHKAVLDEIEAFEGENVNRDLTDLEDLDDE